MVIMHNLLASFTDRQLGVRDKKIKKNIEKLTSGYKINRAADAAAGLAISEKLRRQIRGLDQGTNNIQDGISLVQTADGALGEVTDILQRVRELSVKSYNGTNSESDVASMQEEVDQLLIEVERIGDTTTFNEERIFRGQKDVYAVNVVKTGEELEVFHTYTELPKWLTDRSDDRVEAHPDYRNLKQDMDGNMRQDDSDGNPVIYYGPVNAELERQGYTYGGVWSEEIEDNPSARLDFSGLFEVDNAEALYNKLADLMGGGVAYPCGTCGQNIVIGIGFNGTAGRVSVSVDENYFNQLYDNNSSQISIIDLSKEKFVTRDGKGDNVVYEGYFAAIENLKKEQKRSDKSAAEKRAEAVKLGQEIAGDLRDKVLGRLEECAKRVDHFDRVVANKDDYSLLVYDFRDIDKLTNVGAADTNTVSWGGYATYKVRRDIMVDKGFWMESKNNLYVFAGVDAKQENKINITLPEISLKKLKLNGYQLGEKYTIETYFEYSEQAARLDDEKYNKEMKQYEKDLKKYKEYLEKQEEYDRDYDAWKQDNMTWVKVSNEITVPKPIFGYRNGEWTMVGTKEEKAIETKYIRQTKPGATTPPMPPEPVEEPVKPQKGDGMIEKQRTVRREDVLDPVDEAIKYVSAARAVLGSQQNRLEHAYNQNLNTAENTTAADSRIRDTDMAKEMISFSNNQIVSQSIQSMLAQANQSSQGVLSLLE